MSGRFVRASKFRHVHGEPAKPEFCYDQCTGALTSGEANFIKVNSKFFAYAKSGGGGPLMVHPLSDFGRLSVDHPVINVHKGKVLDFDFHPFVPNVIASGSDDCRINITQFPMGGLTENVDTAAASLKGHLKKIALMEFSPTAANVLASAGYDRNIIVWDVEKQTKLYKYGDFDENILSFTWNSDGSRIVATCKDKTVRVYDPRTEGAVLSTDSFTGTKSSRGFCVDKFGLVGAVGFTRTSQRRIKFWDIKKFDKPAKVIELDQSASTLIPFYDEDTSVLFLAGKGDGSVKYYEITNESPYCFHLSDWRSSTPQKGIAALPKRSVDVDKCEIARFYRLCRNMVEPVSFMVPRKNTGIFQEDLYPEAYAGRPALTADEWKSGANKPAPRKSMDPEENAGGDEAGMSFEAQKSPAELLRENEALKKRVAELEAQVAKLTG